MQLGYWLDKWYFLRTFTLYRIFNTTWVYISYFIAKYTKRNISTGLPFTLSVEPTTNCNLGCPECPSGLKIFTRPTGFIQENVFDLLLAQTARHLQFMYFYFQGEPYMHPDFFSMVEKATAKKIYTITSTNAHFLTARKAEATIASGLNRLIISLDGTTQEVYEKYRIGGSLEKVLEGTKNIVAAKRKMKSATPYVVFQFLVVKHNEHQIDEAKNIAKEVGVDEIVFKSAQVYDYKNDQTLIPTLEQYSRYKKTNDGSYTIKSKLHNQCWKIWHSAVVTWDGKVVPCCFDKDATYKMGNISENNFADIWRNEKYKFFRQKIFSNRAAIDICTNCSEGLSVFSD